MLHGHSERACILVDFQATLMMQALDCMCKWDRLGQLDDLNVVAYGLQGDVRHNGFNIWDLPTQPRPTKLWVTAFTPAWSKSC